MTATDNCQDVEVMFEELEEPGDCPNEWTITRTWSVSDDCGNTNGHTQVLTVVDTTAPELTIPRITLQNAATSTHLKTHRPQTTAATSPSSWKWTPLLAIVPKPTR